MMQCTYVETEVLLKLLMMLHFIVIAREETQSNRSFVFILCFAFPTSKYSRLSLSRPRLSRITAYIEVKFWSLFYDGNLRTGNKILWKRGEIAPKKQFLLFSTIFSIYL